MIYTIVVMIVPNGPMQLYAEAKQLGYLTHEQSPDFSVEDLNEQYKLDKPWPLNFFVWLFDPNDTTTIAYNNQNIKVTVPKGIDIQIGTLSLRGSGFLTGDFGEESYHNSPTPIGDVIAERLHNSIYLLLSAFTLTIIIGIPLGIMSAVRKGSPLDHTLTVFSLAGISIPPYALSYFLIIFLAVGLKSLHDSSHWDWLPWLPAGGFDASNIWARIYYLILPTTALAIPQIARIARYTRSALLDVLRQDFIRTAHAKGLSTSKIIIKHALRNCLVPIIAQLALFMPLYVSAVAAVEGAFGYSGLGREFYHAVGGCIFNANLLTTDPPPCPPNHAFGLDTPLVLPILLFMVGLVALSNFIADTLYVIVDPRISYEARGKARH